MSHVKLYFQSGLQNKVSWPQRHLRDSKWISCPLSANPLHTLFFTWVHPSSINSCLIALALCVLIQNLQESVWNRCTILIKTQFHFQSSRLVGAQPLKPVGRWGIFSSGASVMYVNENQFISRNTFLSLFSSSVSVMYFTANLLAH